MAVARTVSGTNDATLTQHVERALEFLWLLTAAAVPLIFMKPEWVLSEAVNAYVEVPKGHVPSSGVRVRHPVDVV